jgi:hypothetical protein
MYEISLFVAGVLVGLVGHMLFGRTACVCQTGTDVQKK